MTKSSTWTAVVCLTTTVASCSSTRTSAPLNNVVSGTVDGVSLPMVADAQAVVGSLNGTEVATVYLADTPGYCSHLQNKATSNACGTEKPGSTVLGVGVFVPGQSPVMGGSYAVSTPSAVVGDGGPLNGGVAIFAKFDSSCNATPTSLNNGGRDASTSGTFVIAAASSTRVSGSFDLQFPGGHLTGSFDAPVCNVDLHAITPNGPGCTDNAAFCAP